MLRRGALGLIRVYQLTLSPLFYMFGVRCRHEPTCSQYAAEAFRTYPLGRAFALTAHRLGRCHPWGTHGHDPVPAPGAENCPPKSGRD